MATSEIDLRGNLTSFGDRLTRNGFAICQSDDLRITPALLADLDGLEAEFDRLPSDPHCLAGNRYRRHGRAVALPWDDRIILRPPVPYRQAGAFNPTDGETARRFAPLTPELWVNGLLGHLIRWDLAQLPLARADQAIDVGIHLIRVTCTPEVLGVASPNCLHKDGELFTFVHLVRRHDVGGGESIVADNEKSVLYESVLTDPMATLAVYDPAVYHHVAPIRPRPGARRGYRDVLLIDFTPLTLDIRGSNVGEQAIAPRASARP